MRIYLDIETIPGQAPGLRDEIAATITAPGSMKKAETIAKWEVEEKPAAIEDAWRKTAFAGDRGEIVCIAWAVEDTEVRSVFRGLPGQEFDCSEAYLLRAFFDALKAARAVHNGRLPEFIGHNVREFDLRFLFQRAVILGVRPPVALPHDSRPGSEFVFDTMTSWAGWGGRISLNRLCVALGIPTKGTELGGEDIDGSKVWDFVQEGRIKDVAAYCRADVERVRAIHRRMNFVDGERAAHAA